MRRTWMPSRRGSSTPTSSLIIDNWNVRPDGAVGSIDDAARLERAIHACAS